MTVIPETILHRMLVNGLSTFRSNPTVLDSLLPGLMQEDLRKFKNFFLTNNIEIAFNFPRETIKVPSIVLQLQNEGENQAFLADHMGTGLLQGVPEQEFVIDTLDNHGASTSGLSNLPYKVYGDIKAVRSFTEPTTGSGRVYYEIDDFNDLRNALKGENSLELYVTLGTGVGQKYLVKTISNNYIDIVGEFMPQLDSTARIDLRRTNNPTATVGEPSRIYDEGDNHLTRKGALYDATYQMTIMAGAQQEVIYLFYVLKALIMSQRVFLEAQGLQNLAVSASDFSPRTDYTPNIVYQRVMSLKFTYPFSFIEELPKLGRIDFTVSTCAYGEEVNVFSVNLEE